MRAAVLVFAITTSVVPVDIASTALRLALVIVITLVTLAAMRLLVRNQPFATLAAALRWCWWRALPPALLALGYLAFVVA